MFVKRSLSAEDFCSIKQISNPQVHPLGNFIAFSITELHYHENRYVTHLFVIDKTMEIRQLTSEGTNNYNPVWSPNGDEIVFISNISGLTGLWKTKLKPDTPIPLGGISEGLSSPIWSPDAKRIMFLSMVPQAERSESDVIVINRLPFKFDGAGFLKDNWRHLFLIDAEGGAPEPVTTGEYNVLTAAWSPDNRKIVYVANKDEKIKLTMKNNLWLFDCRTKEHTLIPIESRVYDAVSCSPNGKWIAYIGNTEKFGLATKNNLFAYNTETGEELTLTEKFDLKVGDQVNGGTGIAVDPSPVWTPDSKSVYFLTAKRGNGVLFKATLDHKVEQVSDGKNTIESYSFSDDHKVLAFLATNMTSPSEIWISEGGENKKLTRINDEFTNKINLIHGDMFTFKASDGVSVDGWFYKPVNIMRGRCPVILILKGGPHSSCWGNAFSFQAQFLAANGFGVLYTNERGTGGYGEEFAKTARAKYYGERDYKDLMEVMNFILEKFPVDGEKLGVTGYSRGGFLTNWVISHTNRFKAAVTAGGFCDVYSFFGTSDEMHIWCEKNYEGTPWDDEELYMSKSPIRYVEKINTPTMIIHAQQDYRAPMSQAEQLYFSLKRLGKEAEMVIFPGENHSLPRRSSPKHMIEYQQHVLRWFKRFMPP